MTEWMSYSLADALMFSPRLGVNYRTGGIMGQTLQLRGGTGFDLVPLVRPGAAVVFVTAHDEHARRRIHRAHDAKRRAGLGERRVRDLA